MSAAGPPRPAEAGEAAPVAATLAPVNYADLAGWAGEDHAAALTAFRQSAAAMVAAPPKARRFGIDGAALAAAELLDTTPDIDGAAARAFFERHFRPLEVRPAQGGAFFTGYYEPEVAASRRQAPGFGVPLYRRPPDLADIDDANRPAGWPAELRFGRRLADGALVPYHDRAAIDAGALAGRGLELAWLADPIDVFFIHVQGSARLRFADGGTMRLTYAAKSGHPYTAIGRAVAERAGIPPAAVTMATIRTWLAEHPRQAAEVMQLNRSYIFFREADVADPAHGPVAAAGVPLTAGRSLAIDRSLHTFHSPVWVETTLPDGSPFRRLLVAQDTGSAIVGPARGDIFFGSGAAAGEIAGAMRAGGRFVVLAPRGDVP